MKAEAKTFLVVMFVFLGCLAKAEKTDARMENKSSAFPAEFGCSSNAPVAELQALRSEFVKLAPVLNKTTSGGRSSEDGNAEFVDPRPLATRLVSFATTALENPFGRVRNGRGTIGIMQGPRLSWERKHSDEQVEAGRARNALARFVLIEQSMEALPSADPEIQEAFYDAAMDIWLSSADFAAEEDAANRRRAEDGIPSAEAILEWFAGNESFCESVRSRARTRLERMKAPPPAETNGTEEASAEPASEPDLEFRETSAAFGNRSDAEETSSPADRENGQ